VIIIQAIIELLITLIKNVSVIIVLAYVFTRTTIYAAVIEKKITRRHRMSLIILFGIFSIYGTLSGIKIYGAIANIRDLGPAIGGLIAGPWVGLGAGLIGAIHRYPLGGMTVVACTISTVIAGLAGGIFHKIKQGQLRILPAVLLMISIETVHMALVLLISRPYAQALSLIKQIALPMIVTNAAGMAVFSFMTQNLVHEKQTESDKKLIESELKVAREIQMSIVPKIFPPFPERTEFDIHALLKPAKEVGGDFYDFFFINDHTFGIAIGDVSGKGVPASLFMAVTKTLLKAVATPGLQPNEILALVNHELCRDNDSVMFVTVFLGIVDLRDGKFCYSNGGHNPPVLLHKDGSLELLRKTPGMALGVMDDIPFGCKERPLAKDDTLVLYTDGIVEALDSHETLYGEARFTTFLRNHPGLPARELNRLILDEVQSFAGVAPQADDITVLSFRYNRPQPSPKLLHPVENRL
jgi:sigma-B regulation protein RsbU (phosphoserine phosphatase)